MQSTQLLKALADPVRLRITNLLLQHGALCVCELVGALEIEQSVMSRHLGILRRATLVQAERQGKWMYYSINDEKSGEFKQLFAWIIERSQIEEPLQRDIKAITSRPTQWC